MNRKGTERRDRWINLDERRHTRAKQTTGTSKRRQQSKPKPTQGFLGCRAEAARKHEGAAGRRVTFGRGACHGGGQEPHGTHRQTHATLGSLDNVNGGCLYPTSLSFMHLGGKHSSIDSKPWPAIVVGFWGGGPLFPGVFGFFICALKTQNQKMRPESDGQAPPWVGF